jgi:hypothetical protein
MYTTHQITNEGRAVFATTEKDREMPGVEAIDLIHHFSAL